MESPWYYASTSFVQPVRQWTVPVAGCSNGRALFFTNVSS